MIIWGMVGGCHDASIAVFSIDTLLQSFTSTDNVHSVSLIQKAMNVACPELIVWFEKPWAKAMRQYIAGQSKPFTRNNIKKYLQEFGINCQIKTVWHHQAHAAHYYNAAKVPSVIVVIDAIGEFSCSSIWTADINGKLKQRVSMKYPDSLGLFYSAMTQRCGFIPSKQEGLIEEFGRGYSSQAAIDAIYNDLVFRHQWRPLMKKNMHRGIGNWRPFLSKEEIAGATQIVFEQRCKAFIDHAVNTYDNKQVIITGGCAFNKGLQQIVKDRYAAYIPPNPGDAGSAETAVLAYLNK
jgi:carbamoyltransferase